MRRRFLTLFGVGLVGIALLPLSVASLLRNATPPDLPPGVALPPFRVLVALSLVTPTLLLALAVWAGLKCAPRVGLVSFIDDRVHLGTPIWPRLRPTLLTAVVVGLGVAILVVALDAAFHPHMGMQWAA